MTIMTKIALAVIYCQQFGRFLSNFPIMPHYLQDLSPDLNRCFWFIVRLVVFF